MRHRARAVVLLVVAVSLPSAAAPVRLRAPRLVAEGTVSTADDEVGGTLSPDGTELYYAKKTPATIASDLAAIYVSRFERGRWQSPRVAAFSGRYIDFGPSFAPDGRRLYFTSTRPIDGAIRGDTNIWFVEKGIDGAWGDPRSLGAPVDTPGPEQSPTVAADGTLYFASVRAGGDGSFDIFRSRLVDGAYSEPEPLGEAINSPAQETYPYVAPDGRYLIFASTGRADGALGAGSPYPRPDLYVSFAVDGLWTPARRLSSPVNTEASETSPFVSPDGRRLYFASERNFTTIPMRKRIGYGELERRLHAAGNGLGDIFEVDASVLGTPSGGPR